MAYTHASLYKVVDDLETLGEDFIAFAQMDDELAAAKKAAAGALAPATVADASVYPDGTARLVLKGKASDLGHVRVDEVVRLTTLSERAEKVVRLEQGKQHQAQLAAAGFVAADTSERRTFQNLIAASRIRPRTQPTTSSCWVSSGTSSTTAMMKSGWRLSSLLG